MNMATPIRFCPVLEGETAEEFIREAEKNSQIPTRHLTEEEVRELDEIMERSRNFKFEKQC